jgi:hypothetical protein
MNIFPLVLQIAALVCLFLEAFKLFQGPKRPVWGWAGMLLWLLSLMVNGIQLHATN